MGRRSECQSPVVKGARGPRSTMTAFHSTLIPVNQAVFNLAGISANVFFLFDLEVVYALDRGFRTDAFTANHHLSGVPGFAKERHPRKREHPSGMRFTDIRFESAGPGKSTLEAPAEQTTDWTYVVELLTESPLFRIGHLRKNRSATISHLAAGSELQVCNSPQTPACFQPDPLREKPQFLIAKDCLCSQKTIARSSFSLDNALLQQTSLAVWFFARANRFTNDYRQMALKRWSCSNES